MSVVFSPIQLQRFNFVITYNLLFFDLCKRFVMDVRKPLKSKFQNNHGQLLRLTQESAKNPQAGRAVWIYSEFRLRNDRRGAFVCLLYEWIVNIQHAWRGRRSLRVSCSISFFIELTLNIVCSNRLTDTARRVPTVYHLIIEHLSFNVSSMKWNLIEKTPIRRAGACSHKRELKRS